MGSLPASPRHADKPAVSIRTVTNSTAGLMLSPRDWKDTRASVLRQQSTRAPPPRRLVPARGRVADGTESSRKSPREKKPATSAPRPSPRAAPRCLLGAAGRSFCESGRTAGNRVGTRCLFAEKTHGGQLPVSRTARVCACACRAARTAAWRAPECNVSGGNKCPSASPGSRRAPNESDDR